MVSKKKKLAKFKQGMKEMSVRQVLELMDLAKEQVNFKTPTADAVEAAGGRLFSLR